MDAYNVRRTYNIIIYFTYFLSKGQFDSKSRGPLLNTYSGYLNSRSNRSSEKIGQFNYGSGCELKQKQNYEKSSKRFIVPNIVSAFVQSKHCPPLSENWTTTP